LIDDNDDYSILSERVEHGSMNVRYRPSNVGLVPFIAVRPVEMDLPLKSVAIGPCREPTIQKRTITKLLFQKQLLGVSVKSSDLPVRV
jgi:hypothetical protein